MASFLRKPRIGFLVAASLIFVSCLGSGVKTLGTKQAGGTGTEDTDSDSFSITLAYREDANPDDSTIVTLQGVRNLASAKLINLCGANAVSCTCEFYKSTSDTSPAGSSSVGISDENNSVSCTMDIASLPAPNNDPDTYTHVVVKTTDGTKSSGLIQIKTSLTLADVLGDLDKKNVRKIYRYSCSRTFFEGEGVTPSNITCLTTGHRLGIIRANYDFYLYEDTQGGNRGDKGGDTAFDSPICGYNQTLKISCTASTPSLRYGLYGAQAEPFIVAVTMTPAPEGTNAIYGFAALPDSAGNCPTGLVKIRPHQAQPASLISGPNTQGCATAAVPPPQGQLPSSFVNNNSLNNTLVEESSQVTSTFDVTREWNNTPCDGTGDCSAITFGGTCTAQTVAYTALTPIVCAIPPSLATGAF